RQEPQTYRPRPPARGSPGLLSTRDVGGIINENYGSQTAVVVLRDIADEACCIAFHDDLPLSSSEHSARHIEMRGVFTNDLGRVDPRNADWFERRGTDHSPDENMVRRKVAVIW